ncbi:MAG: YdcF family protein [Kosmotogaceae bacterium]
MYYIQKIFGMILSPPGILVVLYLIMSLITIRKAESPVFKRIGYAMLLVSLFFYLLATGIGARLYLKPLETKYLRPSGSINLDVIAVLGGGIIQTPYGEQTSQSTINRLMEGYNLYKKTGKKIIVTGGEPLGREATSEGLVMKDTLISWGVSEEDIIVDRTARNTMENTEFIAEACKDNNWKNVMLVTSAVHMPRAVTSLEKYSLNIYPWPSDYLYETNSLSWIDFLPTRDALEANLAAIHEFIGSIWYRIYDRS